MIKNKLGNFVKIKTGKLDANVSSQDGQYPFFTCSKEPLKISSYSHNCKCVLVAGNGDLNVKYYEGKFDAYQRTYIIESKDELVLDTRYLYWFLLKYVERLRELSIGGVIKYIKINNLTDPIIPLPPLEEQKRIVKILDEADILRQKRKQAIGLLDDYLKSVFLEMFGDPVKNPKGWEMAKLGNYFQVQGGFAFKSTDYRSEGVKLVKIANVHFEDLIWDPIEYVLDKFLEKRSEFSLKQGDFLMALTRPIIQSLGVVKTVTVKKKDLPCLLNQRVARFIPKKISLKPEFLKHFCYTQYFKRKVEYYSASALQPNISTKEIEEIPIFCISESLQDKFAGIVKKTEIIKQQMLTQSTEMETQFQSLIQKAFKGEL